ncbi:MAG: hypothetical protein ACXIUZ_10515 [Lysobacteraceae bacterium]
MTKSLIAAATAAAFAFSGAALANEYGNEEPDVLQDPPATEETYTMPTDPAATRGMAQDEAPAMPETQVSEAQLQEALEQVGYTEVENVDITPPLWSAEAVNPQGDHVLVRIDASTATIVAEQPVDSEDAE